jgi:glycosyltransferase involved in cell wall biosynthesis
MKYDRIIFWQDTPSPHQAPWIRALAKLVPESEIVAVFLQSGLSQDRIALGWQSPDYGNVRILISPGKAIVDQLIHGDVCHTTHIFSGMLEHSEIYENFQSALLTDAQIGVLSEGRDWRGWRGLVRRAYKAPQEHAYRDSLDFVLAMGQVGVRWFQRCGIDGHKLYRFCYVVETPEYQDMLNDKTMTTVHMTAVGQLIKRKRFDLLLMSLKKATARRWQLKIIGDGELRDSLETMAVDFGLSDRVVFTGVLNNVQVRKELAQTDVFILASHWDGWGAVVNEALMSGVPVVCSDYCGAADLIMPGFNGEIFKCDDVNSLARKINKVIERGPLPVAKRGQILEWSHCIEGPTVARYFLDILKHVSRTDDIHPVPPWSA